MGISNKIDQLHYEARHNKWLRYFSIFIRIILFIGFFFPGMQKILGERFTVLSVNHPMGHYLEALFYTGYYYTFIGIMQVTAAILLLIPKTTLLGALIYFPIILNICILSLSVRFDGSLISSPLMVMACLYLLCWDYHKLKFIFPFNHSKANLVLPMKKNLSNKFPIKFFVGVVTTIFLIVFTLTTAYDILPRNTMQECRKQCENKNNPEPCFDYCNCIHEKGQPLHQCMDEYFKANEN